MWREKFFSILNIGGLAVGSACVIMIFLYVKDELSYDQFQDNKDQIYRVNMTNIWVQGNDFFGSTGPGVADAIRENIPEIKEVIRLHYPWMGGTQLITVKQNDGQIKTFEDWNILASDPNFFKIFNAEWIAGDLENALSEPNSVVLTKSTAEKFFGTTEVIGKQFVIGQKEQQKVVQVKALVEDYPDQSHFNFNAIISMNSFKHIERRETTWWWTTFVTYVLIEPNSNLDELNGKLSKLPGLYNSADDVARLNWSLHLHALNDIYLGSDEIPNRLGPVGSMQSLMAFSVVAVLILLLSCVNFMNLSTARYSERAKEIGIQKVLGSTAWETRLQFIFEAFLYSTTAVVLALAIVELAKGWFNTISEKSLTLNIFDGPSTLLLIGGLIIVTGLTAGAYPAWFLTRFKVVEVLKGKVKNTGNLSFRNILVVFQFSISIALISMALLVRDQLHFLSDKDLGFNEEHIVSFEHIEWLGDNANAFLNTLEASPYFEEVSYSKAVPPYTWNQDVVQPLGSEVDELSVTLMSADPNFTSVLGLELVAGRNFFETGEGDHQSVIINESSAVHMGYLTPGNDINTVLGKKIRTNNEEFMVIGVLKDFNFWSVQLEVEPMALFLTDAPMWQPERSYLISRIKQTGREDYQEALAFVEEHWNNISGGLPFSYMFMDDEFDEAFKTEMRFGKVIDVATILAVFIAALGLIGLISYTTEQRTKEFGIRKVLGANLTELIRLITIDFLKLMMIAIVVGIGISFWLSRRWLEDFIYSVEISPLNFIFAAGLILTLILCINVFIVSSNARKNPVNTLRDE